MTDYYEELGVSKNADPETIRAAYRRRAKAAHPDRKGGSGQAMARVNAAYEVLGSAPKRLHYDRTGETKLPDIDSTCRDIITKKILEWCATDRTEGRNLMEDLVLSLKEDCKKLKLNVKKGEKLIERLDKSIKALKVKDKKRDVLGGGLAHHRAALTQQLEIAKDQHLNFTRALDMLQNYEYTWEPEIQRSNFIDAYQAALIEQINAFKPKNFY